MKLLLWHVNKIVIFEKYYYEECFTCKQSDNNINLIDILIRIPANYIKIESNIPLILDQLKDALIEYKPCRDTIKELKLCMREYFADSDSSYKTDLIDWPILKNLKKIKIEDNFYLNIEGFKNLLNGAPNIEHLDLLDDDMLLQNISSYDNHSNDSNDILNDPFIINIIDWCMKTANHDPDDISRTLKYEIVKIATSDV